MQAGLCRMRTESLVAPSTPAGKRFLDARDERPQTAPERSSFLTETVKGKMHRRKPRKIAGVPQGAFLKSDLFLWLNLQPAEFRLRGFDRAILAGVDRDLTRRPRERLLDDVNAGSLIVVVDLELLQSLDGAQQRDAAAQGRVASGRTLSARRLHRDELEPPGRARCCLLQQARDVRAMDQGGQRRDQVDAAVVLERSRPTPCASSFMRSPATSEISCACWRRPTNQGLVADEPEGEADRENGQIRPSTKRSGYPRCW